MITSSIFRTVNLPGIALFLSLACTGPAFAQPGQPTLGKQVVLTPSMVIQSSAGSFDTLIDEQQTGENPMLSASTSMWQPGKLPKNKYPLEFVIDLASARHIGSVLIWDANGRGNIRIYGGTPEKWEEILLEDGVGNKKWKFHTELSTQTRYLRLVKESNSGDFGELLVYEYTPEQSKAALERAARRKAEQAREAELMARATRDRDNRPITETGTLFGALPLVDEIDMAADQGHRTFLELPQGASRVENILGRKARTIANTLNEPSYFAYKIGEGKLLEPGKAYLLTAEIPDDEPRAFSIANRGSDMIRGIQTGQSLGETIFGYTATNLESLKVPHSGKYLTFQQLFWLNETYAGIEMPRGDNARRSFSPVDGFLVIAYQWPLNQTPVSKGAAISRIRLFEVPEPEKFNVSLRLPPEGVPQRHLFYREEMADSVINAKEADQRSVSKHETWYTYHFRNMNFLGMNTFAKDLLEFASPQGWDVQNGAWYHASKVPDLWGNIVPEAAKHRLNVLPYYEYGGSTGPMGLAKNGRDAVGPLAGQGDYTHIRWAEAKGRVDLTDPVILEEFLHILDLTIVRFKDKAHFAGAWIRPRVSQMPISFADPTRERFAKEANGGTSITRDDLKKDEALLKRYYQWWNLKRRDFLTGVRDHLKQKGVNPDPIVLYMATSSEPAPSIKKKGVRIPIVTDDTDLWNNIVKSDIKDYDQLGVVSEAEVLEEHLYKEAVLAGTRTWGNWEWHHACPRPDPENYKDTPGILMTYPFNRRYTTNDPEAMDAFRTKSGLAMIRHYPLNENTMGDKVGYFVTDVDRPGPYGMLAEALAVANGDPWYIGYTSGHIYNRPFPDAVRRFNANFLALPAIPSKRVDNASSDPAVVVRQIDAGKHGTYLAVVNTGMEAKGSIHVRLPKGGRIVEAATGRVVAENAAEVTLNLEPFELRSLQVQ